MVRRKKLSISAPLASIGERMPSKNSVCFIIIDNKLGGVPLEMIRLHLMMRRIAKVCITDSVGVVSRHIDLCTSFRRIVSNANRRCETLWSRCRGQQVPY